METEIRNETVPSLSSLVETFDKLMNEIPIRIMSEEHVIMLKNCWTEVKESYQRMDTQTAPNSSDDQLVESDWPKNFGFGGLLLSAAVHFGFSAAIPKFQGPKKRVLLCITNLVISVVSSASAAIIACLPLFNKEAKNLKDLWKQSLQDNGQYRNMIRVAAHLIIFAARVAILIYAIVVKNKMKVPNFDLSCVPGVADCWSVYRELFKKKSQAKVDDVESDSLQRPSAAAAAQHHPVNAAVKDQGAGITGASDSAYGDQGADKAGTSGAASGDQGDDTAVASGADSGYQGVVAAGPSATSHADG